MFKATFEVRRYLWQFPLSGQSVPERTGTVGSAEESIGAVEYPDGTDESTNRIDRIVRVVTVEFGF